MKPSILLVLILTYSKLFTQSIQVPYGTSWKYLANGSNQVTVWRGSQFNDASWAGPLATWLKQDLAANTQPWTVVLFHFSLIQNI